MLGVYSPSAGVRRPEQGAGAVSVESLSVAGTATFAGAVDMDSTLDVDGAVNIDGALHVDGAIDTDSTLQVDGVATLSDHLQMAADKEVKLGTTGAALYLAASGQTEAHLAIVAPTANGIALIDKDQKAVDRGAIAYDADSVTLSIHRSTSGTQKVRLANVGANGVVDALSGALNVNAGGAVVFGGTSMNMGAPLKLKQYATGALPAFVAGDLVYDSTLSKAKVGGAAAWELITSA